MGFVNVTTQYKSLIIPFKEHRQLILMIFKKYLFRALGFEILNSRLFIVRKKPNKKNIKDVVNNINPDC